MRNKIARRTSKRPYSLIWTSPPKTVWCIKVNCWMVFLIWTNTRTSRDNFYRALVRIIIHRAWLVLTIRKGSSTTTLKKWKTEAIVVSSGGARTKPPRNSWIRLMLRSRDGTPRQPSKSTKSSEKTMRIRCLNGSAASKTNTFKEGRKLWTQELTIKISFIVLYRKSPGRNRKHEPAR